MAVLGANGSGKSTLLRCIAGLLPSGGARQNTRAVPPEQPVKIDGEHKRGAVPVAVVFQFPDDQLVSETIELDAAFGPENIAVPYDEMHLRVDNALAFFLSGIKKDGQIKNLSAGQKQRLALAGTYTLRPEILLLDEPTSMLSEKARDALLDFLDKEKNEGKTILHITHDIEEAKRAERIVVLNDGKITFDGSTHAFTRLPNAVLENWALAFPPPPQDTSGDHTSAKRADTARDCAGKTGDGHRREGTRTETMLKCSDVTAGPLRGVSFETEKGGVTAITGESGSGKTLLLQIVAGLKTPQSGRVEIAEGKTCVLAVQESEAGLFEEFTADDVAFALESAGVSGEELKRRVKDAMDKAGLPFELFADRKTFSLSGGEKRKAAVAGIIAVDSDIILLDEPFSALDAKSRGEMKQLIRTLAAHGKTIVFTANRKDDCGCADRTLLLDGEKTGCEADRQFETGGEPTARNEPRKPNAFFSGFPPLMKFVFCAVATATALIIPDWKPLVALELFFLTTSVLAGYSLKNLSRAILKILPWLALISVFQYVIFNGFQEAGVFLARFLCLMTELSLFLFLTPPSEIAYGAEDFFSPLKAFGIPVRHLSFLISLVFRFIPALHEEADKIITARRMRTSGLPSDPAPGRAGNKRDGTERTKTRKKHRKRNKLKESAALIVPIILRTLAKAEKLSMAATARYYSGGKHTRYLKWKTTPGHIFSLAFLIAFSAILIYVSYVWK